MCCIIDVVVVVDIMAIIDSFHHMHYYLLLQSPYLHFQSYYSYLHPYCYRIGLVIVISSSCYIDWFHTCLQHLLPPYHHLMMDSFEFNIGSSSSSFTSSFIIVITASLIAGYSSCWQYRMS